MSSLIPAIAQLVGQNIFSGIISVNPHRCIQRKSPNGEITKIIADAVLEERGLDELVITDHPVERGTVISDHAYKSPLELNLTYSWSGASSQNTGNLPGTILRQIRVIPQFNDGSKFLRSIYQSFIQLQEEVVLLDVYTGKRIYNNMLIKSISMFTDRTTEHVLVLTIVLKEVIIANTRLVTVSPSQKQQLFPQRTQTPQNNGSQQIQPSTKVNTDSVDNSVGDNGDSS